MLDLNTAKSKFQFVFPENPEFEQQINEHLSTKFNQESKQRSSVEEALFLQIERYLLDKKITLNELIENPDQLKLFSKFTINFRKDYNAYFNYVLTGFNISLKIQEENEVVFLISPNEKLSNHCSLYVRPFIQETVRLLDGIKSRIRTEVERLIEYRTGEEPTSFQKLHQAMNAFNSELAKDFRKNLSAAVLRPKSGLVHVERQWKFLPFHLMDFKLNQKLTSERSFFNNGVVYFELNIDLTETVESDVLNYILRNLSIEIDKLVNPDNPVICHLHGYKGIQCMLFSLKIGKDVMVSDLLTFLNSLSEEYVLSLSDSDAYDISKGEVAFYTEEKEELPFTLTDFDVQSGRRMNQFIRDSQQLMSQKKMEEDFFILNIAINMIRSRLNKHNF